jgi:hypothetical protein
MNKSSAKSEVPGGFEGRAGGSKGNPTPTAKSTALPDPMTTVPYLMDVHGLSLSEAYLLAQRNHEAAE